MVPERETRSTNVTTKCRHEGVKDTQGTLDGVVGRRVGHQARRHGGAGNVSRGTSLAPPQHYGGCTRRDCSTDGRSRGIPPDGTERPNCTAMAWPAWLKDEDGPGYRLERAAESGRHVERRRESGRHARPIGGAENRELEGASAGAQRDPAGPTTRHCRHSRGQGAIPEEVSRRRRAAASELYCKISTSVPPR